ncbi:hypothetical protein ACFVT6_29890 [Streptomyces sp. NPDC058049]|uniref:hypothetical protein n=1 Tax=Streptomyces sp. NPDC058049 TaxID=3346314 RepID=UPI0036EE9B13
MTTELADNVRHSDGYKSVASQVSVLLWDANSGVVHFDSGEERNQALLARAEASGVIGMCWLLLRKGPLDEAEPPRPPT